MVLIKNIRALQHSQENLTVEIREMRNREILNICSMRVLTKRIRKTQNKNLLFASYSPMWTNYSLRSILSGRKKRPTATGRQLGY